MSMISNALVTGGTFSSINDQRQVYIISQTQKSALDRLQEAVAYTAFHNSGEQYDRPKCHPNTRVAVRDKIEKWVLRTDPDTSHAPIMWLSGAAGAGKSAIAQTVAEDFHSRGLLIASFFFGRSDPTRNHAQSLVSTIVYQLYSLLPPPEQSHVLAIIERDPLIFTKSLRAQFEALIVIPLQHLFENGFWFNVSAPHLIILDGLDECLDHGSQHNVLLMLSASVYQFHLPFTFLLASRQEHNIQAMFSSPDFLPIHIRLFLGDTYLPNRDIKLFLRDQFQECRTTHPLGHIIPNDWPSEDILHELTRKSSGHFIYASVVAKYVKSIRHRPDHRLDVVLKLRPASKDLPFSELDVLYSHIFSSLDNVERVLKIISFHILFRRWAHIVSRRPEFNIDDIERILQLDSGEVVLLLCDLASIVGLEKDPVDNQLRVKLLHASLADYLLDKARSKEYFIDVVEHTTGHAAACIQFLSHVQYGYDSSSIMGMAMSCFAQSSLSLKPTEPLYLALRGFSISRIYDVLLGIGKTDMEMNLVGIFGILTYTFLPPLFKFLQRSDSEMHLELFQHHRSEYDIFLREAMRASSSSTPIPLFFALVAIHRKIPMAAFHHRFTPFKLYLFEHQALDIFQLYWIQTDDRSYLEYLSNFLWDPKRSQEFCAGPTLFAQAAKYCLSYLCDHTAFSQKAPHRLSAEQRMRRKNTPWKWHRRVLREDIRGPHETPWLWLRPPRTFDISHSLAPDVLHRKTDDLIYAHSSYIDDLDSALNGYEDPVVKYRIHSEKYHLALEYLNYFFPRAAKLDELVHMCQTLTLASRSQDFPRKSARAWSGMQKYAAQWA